MDPGDGSGFNFRPRWAEEEKSPVPRPRASPQFSNFQTNDTVVAPGDAHSSPSSRSGTHGPASESLLHTQRVAVGLFHVSSSGGDSVYDEYCSRLDPEERKRVDVFDVLAKVFEFQGSSVLNQRDNAVSMLASRLSRAVGQEVDNLVSSRDASLVLKAFHGELLSNYIRWCGFLRAPQVSLASLFVSRGAPVSAEARKNARAAEGALVLLIWGEAGNLRFCPEFLCFLFHKMALVFKRVLEVRTTEAKVPNYLDEIITPAYDILAEQLSNLGHGVIDHSKVCNYDDFNEIFWQGACLKLELGTMFDNSTLNYRFRKTFVERQSWLVPIFAFWRVHTLHLVGLHIMIVGALCDQNLGSCDTARWGATVITLYACSFVRDLWDILQSFYVLLGNRRRVVQFLLNIVRGVLKGFITYLLATAWWDEDDDFASMAGGFFALAVGLELIMMTKMWWGFNMYGKCRSSGGGFGFVPGALRHLSWSVIGSLVGINSVNLYTQIHELPPLAKRLKYIGFWMIVLLNKIVFSYFVVIKKMTRATDTLYTADGTEYDFGVLGTYTDEHNYIYIAALWLGSGLIYFLDMQIWFVLWANIAAAVEGVRRRVGEVKEDLQLIKSFSEGLHKPFFSYLKREMVTATLHTRFAHVWNEIVDAMREEDIISNRERLQLRYFLINLRLPKAGAAPANEFFAPVAQEGEWGPLFTLLPEFLMSGTVQRAVQSAKEFSATIVDELREIKHEEGLLLAESSGSSLVRSSGMSLTERRARVSYLRAQLMTQQYEFLKAFVNDEVMSEMVRQLAATAFILLDALCRSDNLSRSVWSVYRALFASDVEEPGKGVANKEWWISTFYGSKDKPVVKVVAAFSKNAMLFSVDNFPALISAIIDLVKTLNEHVSTAGWNKDVDSHLKNMATALSAVLQTDTETDHGNAGANVLLHLLKDVRNNLDAFVAAGATAPEARLFKSSAKSFLRRTLVFLEAPANSQPGVIKGTEASRRIKFFVDSLTVEQPKPGRVLKMPSFTTLTPYYNEDVVLSVESLREETQDGLTVLEYLRTIYPGEFDNLVERMRVRSKNSMRGFRFDVEVVDAMLGVALDTELGVDVSREGMLKKVERAIVVAVKNKLIDDELEPVETEEIEEEMKKIDIDSMMLQLQLWASNRGQTLSRTVRGMMYYSQAVRLLAVVENIEEFQPAETGYMFGISDRPADNGGDDSDDDNDILNAHSAASSHPAAVGAGGGVSGMSAFRNFFFGVTQQSGGDAEAALDAENAANLNVEGQAFNVLASNVDTTPLPEGAEGADFKGFIQVKDPALDKVCDEYRLTQDLAEAKYRYVVSCQVFGKMQKSKKKADLAKAGHIKMLARMYPGLRIAHVDDVDGTFYSVLSKHAGGDGDDMVEEYRVQLPGQILVGEGKPNNQNHAIIFTRGEAVQAIDMNQDATLEDAIKIRQVMEEFHFAERGIGRGKNIGRIVGFREHVFTHDVSAVANFFSLQELNFVSATQRALDNPLHVRFHYGHPDVFDRMSVITMGGVSKACKGIHLSEDIFAGFNYVLRGGYSTQADYIQVSKGRDTGVSQVTGFTAKISMGNGMQARSREVGRLASQFDMFRLLSFYYSSVGGFMNQVLLMTAVFLYVYAKLYIVFDPEFTETVDDDVLDALSSQFLIQLGFLLILPIPLMLAVEKGLQVAVSKLFNILLRLAPFFFIFSAGTNAFYVNSAVMSGQAKYQATGRGFVIVHEEFVEMYRLYLTSHFNPAFELLLALVVYGVFASSGYFLETFSVYLLVIGLLWTPLLFNPNGLDFTYARQDFEGWLSFMNSPVDDPKKGWLSWYNHVCEEARQELPMNKKLQAVVRKTRLLILVYGFLTAIGEEYGSAWPGSSTAGVIMLVIVMLLVCQSWIQSWAQAAFCPHKAHTPGWQQSRWARLWKLAIFVAVILAVIILATVNVLESAPQAVYYVLAFMVLVYYTAQVIVLFMKDALRKITLVRWAFHSVHYAIGIIIMLPVLALSFLPIFVDLQTRMLFNDDFSQRFSIAKIFAKQSHRKNVKKNA